jgi:predicted transcriptional regulator
MSLVPIHEGDAPFAVETVGDLADRAIASIPSWFPADKAAAVLRQQGKTFALVADRTGVSGVASAQALAAAPPTKSVSWCTVSLAQAVKSDVSLDRALALMDDYSVDCLPVVVGGFGGLIAGIITRDAIEANLAHNAVESHALAA